MHKNLAFKIHRQKLTLAIQTKICKENAKTTNAREEKTEGKENCLCLQGLHASIRTLKKSKSMFTKGEGKEQAAATLKIPSIKAVNLQSSMLSSEEHPEQITYISSNPIIKTFLSALIEALGKKQFKFQSLKSSFLIEKTYFVNILEYLLELFAAHDKQTCQRTFSEFNQCSTLYEQLINNIQKWRKSELGKKICIQSQILSQIILPQTQKLNKPCVQQCKESTKKLISNAIDLLLKEKIKLQDLNFQLEQSLQQKQSQCNSLDYRMKQLEVQSSFLTQQISHLEDTMRQAKTDSQNIFNYVASQKNALLKMASAEYKQIQSDLYQYASYLQANVLASDLDYEPHPYQQIQLLLKGELEQIAAGKEGKSSKIVGFTQKIFTFLDKKDCEIGKLLEFKTKCIRTFIRHMKKWLDNWTLKQEYLTNLRLEFAANANSFRTAFEDLSERLQEGKFCFENTKDNLAILYEGFSKMEQNYKLGNSFY